MFGAGVVFTHTTISGSVSAISERRAPPIWVGMGQMTQSAQGHHFPAVKGLVSIRARGRDVLNNGTTKQRDKRKKTRGAALVEFALIAPFLITLLFAIIEFSWVFSQVLDMRHGAREGARLAAVNYDETGTGGSTQTDEIVAQICLRIDEPSESTVTLAFVVAGDDEVGDYAEIRVERNLETITGFFDSFLGGVAPNSEVSFRLEQDAAWVATAAQACP